jgi:hypothetical protein
MLGATTPMCRRLGHQCPRADSQHACKRGVRNSERRGRDSSSATERAGNPPIRPKVCFGQDHHQQRRRDGETGAIARECRCRPGREACSHVNGSQRCVVSKPSAALSPMQRSSGPRSRLPTDLLWNAGRHTRPRRASFRLRVRSTSGSGPIGERDSRLSSDR